MCSIATAFIASSLFSAYGTYQQGRAASAQQQYQARVAENNAVATRQQKEAVTAKEDIQKERLRRDYERDRASGRVGFASSGVVLGTGSPLHWELAMSDQEVEDLQMIEYQANLERHSLEAEARGHTTQAGMYRSAAQDSRRAGLLGTGASLLSSYSTYRQTFG